MAPAERFVNGQATRPVPGFRRVLAMKTTLNRRFSRPYASFIG
jgi:hypothetical protein